MDIGIGKIIESPLGRDAIHIAVAPAVAGEDLDIGQHVGILNGVATSQTAYIGIVDPFLRRSVGQGEQFYLFLYPNTVTSLRHVWTHPSFESEAAVSNPIILSKLWLTDIANRCGVSYERLINAIDQDDYINMGDNESYRDVIDDKLDDLKKHSEIVLGRPLSGVPYPFSCSC